MSTSVPAAKTLTIAIGDFMNSEGQTYKITNLSSADNGQGFINYTCTLSNGVVIVVNYTNCIISTKNGESGEYASFTTYWIQSSNA